MANYIALQADEAADDPKNLKAVPTAAGEDVLGVALFDGDGNEIFIEDLQGTPTGFAASGHGTQALSTTGAVLPTVAGKVIVIENPITNSINVYWGDSSAQNHILVPGEKLALPLTNLNAIYCKSASGTPSIVYSVFD